MRNRDSLTKVVVVWGLLLVMVLCLLVTWQKVDPEGYARAEGTPEVQIWEP